MNKQESNSNKIKPNESHAGITALQEEVHARFPELAKSEIHGNTLYLEANAASYQTICKDLNGQFAFPLVSMFASDDRARTGCFNIHTVFANRQSGILISVALPIDPSTCAFPSLCDLIPAAALYEREIHDLFGLRPMGHPNPKRLVFHGNWPKNQYPLRKEFPADQRPDFTDEKIEFTRIDGEGVYEIPVGPVHAGIIEPGHFRFSLAGEPILNLEAQLYFVHKGIEKLIEGKTIEHGFYLSERISGDETFTNSLTYCQAVEKIAGIQVPARASYTRVLFAELERVTSHLGDLAGICQDVAYGFASYQFKMLRGWSYRIADELCGMRFLRSVNTPGGIRRDFIHGKGKNLTRLLTELKKELTETEAIVMHNSLFIDRIENTGILKNKIAVDLNATGPGGRASGVDFDVRKAFPYEVYAALSFEVPVQSDGDVSSRMKVKLAECFQSISLMQQVLERIPQGIVKEEIGILKPYHSAYGLTEAPRGENIHYIMTGENNTILRYKVRTPSFCSWPALCHAVSGNIVPDFPLINKSFNLSYAGNDL
ncbi:MAG: formate hydrogenlyase subunit 5 [Bacillota bacterium]|nr:formate hydrogenlyase subunit 5 [Bacillota bacterium]